MHDDPTPKAREDFRAAASHLFEHEREEAEREFRLRDLRGDQQRDAERVCYESEEWVDGVPYCMRCGLFRQSKVVTRG